ncbi:MAG: patatin family protein, partial [Bradyrhizobium sp.]
MALLGAGCATTARLPAVPLALAGSAVPLNIADARYYADTDAGKMSALATQSYNRGFAAGLMPAKAGKHPTRAFLAMSGGGDDGAYGAGLLVGWTARGDRPQFTVVTGVSTG